MSHLSCEWKGMIASFLAYTIFGFGFIFARISYVAVGQTIALAWRFAITFLLLNLIWLCGFSKLRLKGKHWFWLLLLGLLSPTASFLLESWGILFTNASFSSVLVATTPVFALFAAALFLKEIPTRRQILFALLSFAGVVLITMIGSGQGTVTLLGILALVGCIMTYVAFSLLSRKMSKEFSVFERTYGTFLVGSVYFIGFAVVRYWGDFSAFMQPFADTGVFFSILYLGVVSSVFGNLFLNYSLSVLPVARATVFTNWSPVVSIVAGIVFLQEAFTLAQVGGSIMILLGLYGVNRFVRKAPETAPAEEAA